MIRGQTDGRPHVCFVAPTIYPIIANAALPFVGGAEVQQAIIARALRQRGYPVSILTRDHGVRDTVTSEGISIYHLPPVAGRGFRGLRRIHPRLTDVVMRLREIAPDVVYFRSASGYLAACVWYTHRAGKRAVYAAAHDDDFQRGRIKGLERRELYLFRRSLKLCDAITVQNRYQQALLRRRFSREGVIAPNMFDEPEAKHGSASGEILWVGTIKPAKRPDLFLALAERFPDHIFVIVGGPWALEGPAMSFFRKIEKQAGNLPNVRFSGHVPFNQVGQVFDGAALVVNTSLAEGFPNTFLQAWLRGIPSLSFVAPVTSSEPTGTIACRDLDDMAAKLSQLLANEREWSQEAERARRHFWRYHSVEAAITAHEGVIAGSVVAGNRSVDVGSR